MSELFDLAIALSRANAAAYRAGREHEVSMRAAGVRTFQLVVHDIVDFVEQHGGSLSGEARDVLERLVIEARGAPRPSRADALDPAPVERAKGAGVG